MNALSFFQPAYLWALGFLSVILFLHFFRRRIIKRMDISTLRFFPTAAVNKSRVKKLVDLLLLLARLLLVAALIFIFAGPHDKDSPLVGLRDPKSVVYVWIDPTMSMEYIENGKSAGQRALNLIDSLANILPSTVDIYSFDHESGRFVSIDELTDGNEARDNFAGRFRPVDIEEAAAAFINMSALDHSAVFMILSDFQKGTTEAVNPLLSKLSDNSKNIVCISFMPSNPFNYSVRASVDPTQKDGVSAIIRAHGAPLDSAVVELFVGDLRIGQRTVSCLADDSVTVTFDMPPAAAGSWGRIILHAADPLPFDNSDYFTISGDARRSVLIIGNTERNRVIEAAMRAAGPAFWRPIVRRGGSDLSYDDLNSADLVIVNHFNGRSRILESFITGAGSDKGIIITLDPDREDDFGRIFLRSSGILRGTANVTGSEGGFHPVLADTNSALWRGFPALSSRNASVYRYINPIPGDVLVRLSNVRPMVSSVNSSGANMVIVATPIGVTQANNLCETGFYVPFIDRLGRYALSGRGQDEEAWYAGHVARNPFFGVEAGGTLFDLDGRLIASWSNQPFVRIDRPGVFALTSSLGETSHLAVSVHPSESEMIFIRPDLQDADGIYYFEYRQFLEQAGNLSNNLLAYWLWIILGLLLCLEVFLWKRSMSAVRVTS
ncbi:MAG: BatA domain-containing protein [Chitinispirillales bacterium]|nr:BatA domain-containing protein [Chitinispirillales bacterium]